MASPLRRSRRVWAIQLWRMTALSHAWIARIVDSPLLADMDLERNEGVRIELAHAPPGMRKPKVVARLAWLTPRTGTGGCGPCRGHEDSGDHDQKQHHEPVAKHSALPLS